MSKIIINHVMSQDVQSNIYSSIINYFKEFSGSDFQHITTVEPISEASVWHYHRPHLEKRLKPRSVVTVHHDLSDTDPWLSYEKFHDRYKESQKIVCLNTQQKAYLTAQGITNTTIIPHGYNRKVFIANEAKQVKEKYTFLVTSRRYGRRVKGEAYIIDLLKYLDNTHIAFILVGQDRSLDAPYFEKFGFETKIYDRLPYKLFNDLYRQSDFLLMPSYFEGGPANIPEAVATCTPIICNPIGMAADLVQNMRNGLYLTMDPVTDGENINSLIKSPNKIAEIFANSATQEHSSKAITWEKSIKANCDIYREIN
ncbi:glycosyltransferase family 4 protein [Chitinilyticum piscinae]|uniref:Glycosyltransferase family 4 protein n=1 Tax=Chitinilyticum piscinae TaxID=2866724 RepID=A0A8J7FI80_9NEIS|nr:glycosyltransferase family 4 protein [Chitinilyticum piscinae]MBE9607842.1 glycosyltransferase family 4 protein [Chitinilyticum piscinae]